MDVFVPVSQSSVPSTGYRVRGRVLLPAMIAALVLGVFLAGVPGWFGRPLSRPLAEPTAGALGYLILLAFLLYPVRRSGGSLRTLVGDRPPLRACAWAGGVALAHMGIAFVAVAAVFVPLSYIAPGFVQFWIIDMSATLVWTEGDHYRLANVIGFIGVCLLGPFVEELMFRGLLLPAWSARVGRRWGLIWTSLCFAILHVELFSSFVFGLVTGMAFLHTRSLALPVAIHVLNNTLVWVLAAVGPSDLAGSTATTLESFRQTWWLGLVGLPGIPAMIFLMRRVPGAQDSLPGGPEHRMHP